MLLLSLYLTGNSQNIIQKFGNFYSIDDLIMAVVRLRLLESR